MPRAERTFSRRVRLSQTAILTAVCLTALSLVALRAATTPQVAGATTVQVQAPVSPVNPHRVSNSQPDTSTAVAR
jgi:hypothetical protein